MEGEVTALKVSNKRRGRVEVYLEGIIAFEVSNSLSFELKVGQILSEEKVKELKQRDQEERVFQQAVRQISKRPRAERELRISLSRRSVSKQGQDRILQRLSEAGLVDDKAFTVAWVENRNTFRPRSAWALRHELVRKGIPEELIETVLEDFNDEEAAYRAASMAARKMSNQGWDVFRVRLSAHLSRRGFQYSTISPVVKRVWDETTAGKDESEVEKWK